MDRSPAEQELNRIERELDENEPPGGKPPVNLGGGQSGKSGNRSLDAVLVTALLLVAVAASLVFAGQLSKDQCMQLRLVPSVELLACCWAMASAG